LLESSRDNQAGAAPPTVYRALDFLLENGFIHKLESINAKRSSGRSPDRYACNGRHPP
jgi:Fe2+ or Zn2+ uptake regulation protein